MKVKPVNPSAVIRDPHTRRPLPAEGGDVPETSFWIRRLRDGDVVRIDDHADPVGNEPIAPLTTRSKR
jgi:hypothetical protein